MHPRLQQHPELRQFYRELWAWILNGCPRHRNFRTDRAICPALRDWLDFNPSINSRLKDQLFVTNTQVLKDYFFDSSLPFNKNMEHYSKERCNYTTYKNKLRLTWVYKQSK